MFEHLKRSIWLLLWVLPAVAGPAWAQITIPGADGSDGVFAPTANVQIDLSQAPTATWNSSGAGNGVYDPDKWAVVFKYSSVNIPTGVTVTFINHDSRAPVVWLVSGDVAIAGSVNLNGANETTERVRSEPGPGGFGGGVRDWTAEVPPSGGFGVGGGTWGNSYGNHATVGFNNPFPTYGNPRILPLVGGSGGGAGSGKSGGGGGGALLLAVAGTLTIDGEISAHGGLSSYVSIGAGGAIRLIADTIAGDGMLRAVDPWDGSAGEGRIRIETLHTSAAWDVLPMTNIEAPDDPVLLWPPAGAPSVRVVSVGGSAAPVDPRVSFDLGQEDIRLGLTEPGDIVLQTTNVDPVAATVRVRITPKSGEPFFVDAALDSGTIDQATWSATATLPEGYFTVQAHAVNPAP